METNVNYTLVGAFVIVLVTSTVLAIIWLSSGFSFEQYKTYQLLMQESVSGLSIDSPVEFNGVNVGSVKAIELDHHNPQIVNVFLNIKSSTPITQGTFATLAIRGVTGFTYISLKDKSIDLRPLVALPGQAFPIIKTSPSFYMRLDTALRKLSKNIETVAESIHALLNPENLQSIKVTLHNFEQITGTFAAKSRQLSLILDNTAKASREFTPLVESTMGTMKLLQVQTLPTAYRLLTNLDDATRTLSAVAEQVKQNPSVLIRGAAKPAPGPGETK